VFIALICRIFHRALTLELQLPRLSCIGIYSYKDGLYVYIQIIFSLGYRCYLITRSQAVARIADRTARQHLWGHVTSSVT